MKKIILAFLFFIISSQAFAYREVFNPYTGRLDKVGVQDASKDVLVANCANGQTLKYNGTVWLCGNDNISAGGGSIEVSEDNVFLVSADTLNFTTGLKASIITGTKVRVSGDMATTTTPGIASFDSSYFTVGPFGGVSLKNGTSGTVQVSEDGVTVVSADTINFTTGLKATTSASGKATVSGDMATLTSPGIASFDTSNFSIGSFGGVSIKDNGVLLTTETVGNYAAGDAEAGNALTGDSATSFFSTGTLEVGIGGTGNGTPSADAVLVGNVGGTGYNLPAIPDCDNATTSKLLYSAGTTNFTCGADQNTGSSGGAGTIMVSEDGAAFTSVDTLNFTTGIKATFSGTKATVSGDMATTTTPGIASFDTTYFTVGPFGGVSLKTVPVNTGGTGLTSISNDAVLVGNVGGTGFDSPALPNCLDSGGQHLNYLAATNSFACGTTGDGTGGAGSTNVSEDGVFVVSADTINFTTGLKATTSASGKATVSGDMATATTPGIASFDSTYFNVGPFGGVTLNSVVANHTNIIYVGKHGSDANNGKTPSLAKLTVGGAISIATSSDTIFVYPGTYTENGLNLPSQTNLIGADRDSTIITDAPTGGLGTDGSGIVEPQGNSYIANISIIDTTNPDTTTFTDGIDLSEGAGKTVEIQNVRVDGGYDAIFLGTGLNNVDLIVRDSIITARYDGIGYYGDTGSSLEVYNTYFNIDGTRAAASSSERAIAASTNGNAGGLIQVSVDSCYVDVSTDNTGGETSGFWAGELTSSTNAAIFKISNSFINVNGVSGGTASGVSIITSSALSQISVYNSHIQVTGGTNNYDAQALAGTITFGHVDSAENFNGTVNISDRSKIKVSEDSAAFTSIDTVNFTTGLKATFSGSTATVSGDMATTTTPGIASFDSTYFTIGEFGGVTLNTVPVTKGGTGLASVSNDAVLVGNLAGTGYDQPALPNCLDSGGSHLNYIAATNSFACGTTGDGTGGAGATNVSEDGVFVVSADTINFTTGLKATTSASGKATVSGDMATTIAPGIASFDPTYFSVGQFGGVSLKNGTSATVRVSEDSSSVVSADTINFTTGLKATTSASGIATVSGDMATTTTPGIASFDATQFRIGQFGGVSLLKGDAGTIMVSEDSAAFTSVDTINFTTGLKATFSGSKATVSGDMATTTTPGIASFDPTYFTVGPFGGVTFVNPLDSVQIGSVDVTNINIVSGEGIQFTLNTTPNPDRVAVSVDVMGLPLKATPVTGDMLLLADFADGDRLKRANFSSFGGGGGGGGTPGGSATQVQYNNSGTFGGITNTSTDGTTISLTSPKIITGLNDSGGNALIKFTVTSASVVNAFAVSSDVTGLNPTFSAIGSDANVGIEFEPKGTGAIVISRDTAQVTATVINHGLIVNNARENEVAADFNVKTSQDSLTIYAVASSDKVGIGNNSPQSKLSVSGDVLFTTNLKGESTTDIGWSVQNSANQACNTTCNKGCVFGFNTGALGNLLACTDATADSCLCAGAS